VAWAVWQHGAWRHPTQLYLSAGAAIILFVIWRLARRLPPENALFFAQGALYCLARFTIEFWRVSPPVAAGLTMAQWACIGGACYFGARYWRLAKQEQAVAQVPQAVTEGA
jgi:phosphatidylglycerol:prolipoprotein diacylglycerol transferase